MDNFRAFGLRQIDIKLQGAGTVWTRVKSSEEASYKQTVQQLKMYGDETLQTVFNHTMEGSIMLKHNLTSLQLFKMLSGNDVGSITGDPLGPGVSQAFGTQSEMLQPYVSIRAMTRARRDDGGVGVVRMVWYKCMVHTAFEGMGFKRATPMELSYTFEVLSSDTNEYGASLACSAFGRTEAFDNDLPAC